MKLLHYEKLVVLPNQSRLKFDFDESKWWFYLYLDNQPIYNLGSWCQTCAFCLNYIGQQEIKPFELSKLTQKLANGSLTNSSIITTFKPMLPTTSGNYIFTVFELIPSLVNKANQDNYFHHDLPLAWSMYAENHWSLINSNQPFLSPYYKGDFWILNKNTKIFEFISPLYTPDQLNESQIIFYEEQIKKGIQPIVMSIGMHQAKYSMTWPEVDDQEREPDYPNR